MACTTEPNSTLYPKITNHIADVVKTLRRLNGDAANPTNKMLLFPIPITGTVKLHGTHADVVVYVDNRIVFQSRNITGLSVEKDNQGFAEAMSEKSPALLCLRDSCVKRWRQMKPEQPLDESLPIILAGEWIGTKIQKDVAIAQLSRRFVIVSLNINGQWQKDSDFYDISLPDHNIYNIARAGTFHATLYPDDIDRTIVEVGTVAEEVAAHCPFAATFGVNGEGEGVVWKLDLQQYNANPELWVKTKGGKFKPRAFRPPKTVSSAEASCRAAADAWCSTQRLEQAWDVLREKGVERENAGLDTFLRWVQEDIVVEEKGQIGEGKLAEGQLRTEITKIAKPWYFRRVSKGGY
jgi:hypothetical protein